MSETKNIIEDQLKYDDMKKFGWYPDVTTHNTYVCETAQRCLINAICISHYNINNVYISPKLMMEEITEYCHRTKHVNYDSAYITKWLTNLCTPLINDESKLLNTVIKYPIYALYGISLVSFDYEYRNSPVKYIKGGIVVPIYGEAQMAMSMIHKRNPDTSANIYEVEHNRVITELNIAKTKTHLINTNKIDEYLEYLVSIAPRGYKELIYDRYVNRKKKDGIWIKPVQNNLFSISVDPISFYLFKEVSIWITTELEKFAKTNNLSANKFFIIDEKKYMIYDCLDYELHGLYATGIRNTYGNPRSH